MTDLGSDDPHLNQLGGLAVSECHHALPSHVVHVALGTHVTGVPGHLDLAVRPVDPVDDEPRTGRTLLHDVGRLGELQLAGF